jgi:hypothetical protein
VYALVAGGDRHGRRPLRAGCNLGGLLVFGLFCIAGIGLSRHFGSAGSAGFAVVPGCLLYTPLLVLALPGGAGGYRYVREDLGEIGADRRVAAMCNVSLPSSCAVHAVAMDNVQLVALGREDRCAVVHPATGPTPSLSVVLVT